MPELQNSIAAVLHSTRKVWAFLLVTQFFYVLVAWRFIQHPQPPYRSQPIVIGIAVVTLLSLIFALYFHIKLTRRAGQSLQTNPTAALANWSRGLRLTMALAESICLYGFALLAIGVPLNQAAPFYATGTIATLFFFPKNPAKV